MPLYTNLLKSCLAPPEYRNCNTRQIISTLYKLTGRAIFIMDTVTTLWNLNTLDNAKDYLTSQTHKPFRLQSFVNNDFSAYPVSDEWIDSCDPCTGETLAQIPRSTQSDVDRAVDAASRAFPSWSQTSRHERSETLLRIADCLSGERELFAVWESIDQGKTLARARIEVERAIANFRLVFLLT